MTLLRRPRSLMLAALAALLAAVAAGCGSGGTETRVAAPLSPQTLSSSAQTSADETSAQFTFSMTMSAPGLGEALSFSGNGAFDSESETATMTLDMSSFAQLMSGLGALGGGSGAPDLGNPDDWKIEIVSVGQVVYMNFPLLASQLPGGKTWMKIDAAEAARLEGFDIEQLKQFGATDPREMLKFLEAVAGDIETVGTEEVGGVSTTHYRATIDMRRFAELFPPEKRDEAASLFDSLLEQTGLGMMPVEVWLDDEQRVRKFVLDMSAAQPGGTETFSATMTMEMFGYGEPVDVALPPDDQVVDLATLVPQKP